MSFSNPPISSAIAQAVVDRTVPWRLSQEVSSRIELQLSDGPSPKKYLLLPSDSEMEFVRRYFFSDKPKGLTIGKVYCFEDSHERNGFETLINVMEIGALNSVNKFRWIEELDDREGIDRWKKMANLFGPFRLEELGESISKTRVLPLWSKSISGLFSSNQAHRSHSDRVLSVNSRTSFEEMNQGIDEGQMSFTPSARYAALSGAKYLILSWVMMSPSQLVIKPIETSKNEDGGEEIRRKYDVEYIPATSFHQSESVDQPEPASFDEFVVFDNAQIINHLWIELVPELSDSASSTSYSFQEAFESAQLGDLLRLEDWVKGDSKRLQMKTKSGETLLYGALFGNQLPVIRWIHSLDKQLIHEVRRDGKSLLFLAVFSGKREILDWFLEQGVSYSPDEFTMEAEKFGYSKTRIIESLKKVDWFLSPLPSKDPHFRGRQEIFSLIEEKLSSNPLESFSHLTLLGESGIGKSALAIEYLHRFRARYSFVWWIDGGNRFESELRNLGIELKIISSEEDKEEMMERVLKYLEDNPGWLLVFDNLSSATPISSIIPKRARGHVFITSRGEEVEFKEKMTLRELSPEDALAVLESYVGGKEPTTLLRLSEELPPHPLVLAQAGAYMLATSTSCVDYLNLYLAKKGSLKVSSKKTNDRFEAVWDLSVERLKGLNPKSVIPLFCASYLDCDKIPLELLKEKDTSSFGLSRILKTLETYRLLSLDMDGKTVSMNRLFQTYLQKTLPRKEREDVELILERNLQKEWQFDGDIEETWERAKEIVPHLERFCNFDVDQESMGSFLYDLGTYFHKAEFDLSRAINFYTRAFPVKKNLYGEGHRNVGVILNDLGLAYEAKGDFEKAIHFYTEALEATEDGEDRDRILEASVLDNLGDVYSNMGDFSRTIEFYKQSLTVKKQIYGASHLRVAEGLYNLGLAYEELGSLDKAIEVYTDSLALNKKNHGKENRQVARILVKIGSLYEAKGNLKEATGLYRYALAIYREISSDEDLEVARVLASLGNIRLLSKLNS